MLTRRSLLSTALAAAPVFTVGNVRAQTYPSRPIKVIVPFPAGGPTDAMARIVSDRLSVTLKQSIVIENHGGGAGGSIGAKAVISAEPDGYTVLLTPPGPLTVGPAVFRSIDYDPLKVFTPVGLLIVTPLVMCIAPSVPVKTLTELVAYAKANPGKIVFGSQGYGTAPHLLTEMLKLETGVNIVHVPYRGTNPAITDLLAGQIQMFTDTSTVVIPQIQAGKLRRARRHHAGTQRAAARRADHGRGRLSEAEGLFLARRRCARPDSRRHRWQAQRRFQRQPARARDAGAA